MNNQQPYTANRFKCEMKPEQTARLKAVAEYYGYTNLTHTVNVVIDSLYKALKLDEKETKPN
ncbi:MAG: hypothetical protein E6Q69_05505 [Aquipseudomonas alcaligenes]|uniref:Uncharacterized protein n=1 Tax=Aquipseudomonas alcaligenes TaxID=43263 RepID=A0A5C7WB39_AQUAC|nr:MAG: hypothetical protein E6Q69_05505 [Pseudomonas alcaligenes]